MGVDHYQASSPAVRLCTIIVLTPTGEGCRSGQGGWFRIQPRIFKMLQTILQSVVGNYDQVLECPHGMISVASPKGQHLQLPECFYATVLR